MKPPRFRFSLFTLLVVTAVIAVGVMMYQRHAAWQKGVAEFEEILATSDLDAKVQTRATNLFQRYPELAQRREAIQWTVSVGSVPLTKLVLAAGAVFDDGTANLERQGFITTLFQKNNELAVLLLDHGATAGPLLGPKSDTGSLPSYLHAALALGNHSICEELLRRGADPNLQDIKGRTPLHLAVNAPSNDQLTTVTLLLKHGAKFVPDVAGQTPLDVAIMRRAECAKRTGDDLGYDEVIALLKE